MRKHGLKESSIKTITRHIESTIQEFRESNTEMRPQSPPGNSELLNVTLSICISFVIYLFIER